MSKNKPVRVGVIGCGVMGSNHLPAFAANPDAVVAAVADHDDAKREQAARTYEARAFREGADLIASGEIDAVMISTPHYSHAPLTITALDQGLHVLCEKPLTVTAQAAQGMIDAAARHPDRVFAAMFQMRTQPIWRTVKELIAKGEIGELKRFSWTITTWFRSQAYYDSGDWRATWSGEGGGLLINQCPHNLDLLCWLVGQPSAVTSAQIGLGKHHQIEVEDEVAALLRFPNGASGSFISSTAEIPGVNRLEIVGDRGTIITGPQGPIELFTQSVSSSTYSQTTRETMAVPDSTKHVIQPGGKSGGNRGVIDNFIDAILNGAELIAPAGEGIRGLELGNAILMSGLKGQPVELPMDREAYERLIKELVCKSSLAQARQA